MEQNQTREERINELLNQTGFEAASAIKGPTLSDVLQPEQKAELEPDVEEEETQSGGKKVRIPASRLKTLTTEVAELKAQLQEKSAYEERIAALESQLTSKDDDVPEKWLKAYGDTEMSRQAYHDQQAALQELVDSKLAERDSQSKAQQEAEQERIEAIEQSFDEQMDDLEESLGRSLTASQKTELLDIIDEYSPTDKDGRIHAFMSVEKAYDIWSKGQGSESKRAMADIAGMQSSGAAAPSSLPIGQQDWRSKYGL